MPKVQQVAVTLRFSAQTKALLQEAAQRDHRSMSNMVEVLILNHCQAADIAAPRRASSRRTATKPDSANGRKPSRNPASKP